MSFIVSAVTDVGISRAINQDCYQVRNFLFESGEVIFAVLCDGMGGLSNGEVASKILVDEFDFWAENILPQMCRGNFTDADISNEWCKIIEMANRKIRALGDKMGTTVTAILITSARYYIINVGDSRAYEISDRVTQITRDHTLVQREIDRGNLTKEAANADKRRNILLQCVGASNDPIPDMFFGETKKNVVYMLCSDGFRHKISDDEMLIHLNAGVMTNISEMKRNMKELVLLNKERDEHDDITVITIRTY